MAAGCTVTNEGDSALLVDGSTSGVIAMFAVLVLELEERGRLQR